VDDPRQPGRLLAAAGTHAVCLPHAIAAVWNVFTLPEARGQGLARQTTSAVTAVLFDRGCSDVVLNVAANNASAIHVYERIGYAPHCRYWEGQATLR